MPWWTLAGIALVLLGVPFAAQARLRGDLRGEQLYARECAACHGATGRGDGPEATYFTPPPRNLREGFLRLYEIDELILRVRSGQALDIDVDRSALRQRERMVDDILAHVERLPDVRWEDVARGSEIWSERCETCHGPFGRPASGIDVAAKPSVDLAAAQVQRRIGDARVIALAQHHDDPAIELPALEDPHDRRAIVAYVRLLSPGFELYSVWCAGCHGDDASGEGELAAAGERPGVALDRAYLRAHTAPDLRRQLMHMIESGEGSMPHLQDRLSEDQVRSIIEYLRATEPLPAPSRSP